MPANCARHGISRAAASARRRRQLSRPSGHLHPDGDAEHACPMGFLSRPRIARCGTCCSTRCGATARWPATCSNPPRSSAARPPPTAPTCRSCSSPRAAIATCSRCRWAMASRSAASGLYPCSRGRVHLASSDPLAAPRVAANFLSDPADLKPLLFGLKLARRLFAAESFSRYAAHRSHARARRSPTTPASPPMCAALRPRCIIRLAPAAWAWMSRPWSTPSCACVVSRACAWWTPRSARTWWAAIPTPAW